MEGSKTSTSIEKVIRVIEYLSKQDIEGAPLAKLSRDLEVNKATIHHTLSCLKTHGWVQQHPKTGYYQIGLGLVEMLSYFSDQKTVKQILHPILNQISLSINELVHLGVMADRDILYLDKVEPNRSIRVVSHIGKRVTAVTTALGRAILGMQNLPEDQLALFTAGVDKKACESFNENCEHVRRYGWSSELEENERGIGCVAVPLLVHGNTEYAISITAPIERMHRENRVKYVKAIVEGMKNLPSSYDITVPDMLLE